MKKVIILLAVVFVGLVFWWNRKSAAPPVAAGGGSETVEVRRGTISSSVQSTATITPENKLEIKPPIAGRAESVLVDIGDKVKKGQPLAMMSSSERAALLDAARSKGEKEVKFWEDVYRAAPLVAPLDGVIISRSLVPGQVVQTSDVVFIMSDHLIAKADMDETDLAKVRDEQPANVTLDSYPETKIAGEVFKIAYHGTTTNNVTTYAVEVALKDAPEFVKSGMTANVFFLVEEKKDVLLLPADAVGPDKTVQLAPARRGAEPETVTVETGVTDGESVEIVSGLAEGQKVLRKSYALPPEKKQTGMTILPRPGGRMASPTPPPP